MNNPIRRSLCLSAVALSVLVLGLVPYGFGNSTASMTLTSAGNNTLGGVYVGPYTATINGVSTLVICNDFTHDSFIRESWTANINTFSTLGSALWAGTFTSTYTQLYNEAAWLTLQMLKPANSSQIGDIHFAIWQVFNSSAFSYLTGSDLTNAQNWLTQAQNQTYTAGEFSNFTIYTPNTSYPITCSGHSCPSIPPQEFFVVAMPEGGSAALYLLAAGIPCFGAMFFQTRLKKRWLSNRRLRPITIGRPDWLNLLPFSDGAGSPVE